MTKSVRFILVISGLTAAVLLAHDPVFRLGEHEPRDVTALIEGLRVAHDVPAVACAVIWSNRVVGLGASGLRKAGAGEAPVTLHDKWHHGSLTKSMTATLAAMLVEEGRLRWDSTLAEVFPDLAPGMHASWRGVRLDWLCSNRSGAPGDLAPSGIWAELWSFQVTPREGRRLLLNRLTALPPASEPGTRYEYSVLWLAPNREFGVVAVCNAASRFAPDPGARVTDEIASRMIGEFLP